MNTQSFLSVLRAVGVPLHCSRTQKLFGFPAAEGKPVVELMSLMGVAGMLEVVGGALLFFGLFTRPIAFLLCGEMAVAYFMRHAPKGFWPILNGGELAALYCFVFLFVVVAGPGPWSLDHVIQSWRASRRLETPGDRRRAA